MYLFYLKLDEKSSIPIIPNTPHVRPDISNHFKSLQETEMSPAACDAARRFITTQITESLHQHQISQLGDIQPNIV